MDANSRLLREAFDDAVAAARPEAWLEPALDEIRSPAGLTLAIALGKSSVGMARVFARHWDGPFDGIVVTPHGTAEAVEGFTVLEAAHPVPDEASLAAGEAALALAATARPDDLVLVLLSGGASALACAPIEGVTLAEKAEVTRRLLSSGVGIEALNTVRQALSRLKAGGLVRVAGEARVATIAQSDVPMDDLRFIGSGPGVPTAGHADAALDVLQEVAPDLAEAFTGAMRRHEAGLAPVRARWEAIVGLMLDEAPRAADRRLREAGCHAAQSGEWTMEAVAAAKAHVGDLAELGSDGLISWGELSVAVPPGVTGRGGRNLHFLLALAIELAGRRDVWALAGDTDGIDGTSSAAGAWLDPALLGDLDVDAARAALAAFDSHEFFARQGRLIESGPTGVNVGDLRIVLVA